MAYVPSELRLLVPTMDNASGTPQIWSLQAVDATSVARGANFISDARARGMKKGDIVLYTRWDNISTKATVSGVHQFVVLSVSASGADMTDGSAIDVTNT